MKFFQNTNLSLWKTKMDTINEGTKKQEIRTIASFTKRLLDVIGAVIGLILSFPLMILIAFLIILDSDGPIIFIQERFGKDGKCFKIYKFRSMVKDAESRLGQLINLEELDEPVFKIRNDPRVTRFGHILRRTKMDELPQFINVLKGDMSLVGPRPEEVKMAERYNSRQRTRLLMKPGITGPVQICGKGNLPLTERVVMEEEYIFNYTLIKDFEILMRTIPAIISGNGGY
jgi:lipopolysaccharide/colanic/teichoic acid biosynthesis glycosyltransferase